MAIVTKFMKFSWLFCFRCNFSLTNSTQFGNDSNYSKFSGENISINCFMVNSACFRWFKKESLWLPRYLKTFSHQITKKQLEEES